VRGGREGKPKTSYLELDEGMAFEREPSTYPTKTETISPKRIAISINPVLIFIEGRNSLWINEPRINLVPSRLFTKRVRNKDCQKSAGVVK
jgi:hypothetical protein